MKRVSFVLVPVPPFRLDLTVWALRRRPTNQIDRWDGHTFRRVLEIDHEPAEVTVQQDGAADRPSLLVSISARSLSSSRQKEVKNQLERMLGLRQDLSSFYRLANQDPKIAPLVEEFRGLKPPRFPTVFEAVANGIACQQLSLLVGILLLSRLAGKYGQKLGSSGRGLHSFPSPEDLSGAGFRSLRALGFSGHKAEFLLAIAAKLRRGNLDLEELESFDDQATLEALEQLPGIGRWTAEYVLLRGIGRLNVFPGDDVGAQNNLARFLGRRKPLDYESVGRAVAKWQPYAGFIYFHLLLTRIRDAGWLRNGERAESAGFRRNAAWAPAIRVLGNKFPIEVVVMNILDTVGISLPCQSCGNRYQVPLRDVLLSHTILHEGCPVHQETECPPVFQSRLFERKDIEELQRAWNQLEQRARADGGQLVLMAVDASEDTQLTGRGKAVPSSGRPSEASVPTTLASRQRQERVGKQSERTQKAKTHKQKHLQVKTGSNRRIA